MEKERQGKRTIVCQAIKGGDMDAAMLKPLDDEILTLIPKCQWNGRTILG